MESDTCHVQSQLRSEVAQAKTNFAVFEEKLMEAATAFFGKMNSSIDAATDIMEDIERILNSTCNYFVTECKLAARHLETESQTAIIKSVTHAANNVKESLKKMNTEHKIRTTLTEKGLFQMPKKRTFDEVNVQIEDSFQTVKSEVTILPIEFQIQNFLGRPKILQCILDHQEKMLKRTEHSHFLNCDIWKKLKDKFGDKDVVPIFLYNDDFGPDDTISPHGTSNKISAFYYR